MAASPRSQTHPHTCSLNLQRSPRLLLLRLPAPPLLHVLGVKVSRCCYFRSLSPPLQQRYRLYSLPRSGVASLNNGPQRRIVYIPGDYVGHGGESTCSAVVATEVAWRFSSRERSLPIGIVFLLPLQSGSRLVNFSNSPLPSLSVCTLQKNRVPETPEHIQSHGPPLRWHVRRFRHNGAQQHGFPGLQQHTQPKHSSHSIQQQEEQRRHHEQQFPQSWPRVDVPLLRPFHPTHSTGRLPAPRSE